MRLSLAALALAGVAFLNVPVFAQQTTGTVLGRVLDAQGAAIPGASVTARNESTGFARTVVSDAEGAYRLNALPVGEFTINVELSGFSSIDRKGIVVNVGQTITLDFSLKVASVAETITVTGAAPLIESTASSVGGVVDIGRIESLPLNGRQFANLAATIPGVGLGFHSDPTKSTQFSPQINGGNGRNVNYQIDGGDNNDDTVGGLLQLFPLEAIQEFNFVTSRSKAENGRSNGGVMNIVTKSGTNDLHGSFFTNFRNEGLNATTTTEKNNKVEKGDYSRYQYGGSFGGPIVKDKIHYFGAAERTQQKTFQSVSTKGLFPSLDGVYATPYTETLLNLKATANMSASQYLSVRYGRNQNSQPYGASASKPPNGWGTSENSFNSINMNHNWILGGTKLNEFIFQYADFSNHIGANSSDPYQTFPNGVAVGQSPNTPQTTQQKKYQFRDDFSWHLTGKGGVGHDMKAGVNFINEPRLFITFNSGKGVMQHTHLDNNVNGPISNVTMNDGDASANIPLKQYAFYMQDDWRIADHVTLNLGLRYDYIDGYQFDQSKNPNFVAYQAAGKAGLLKGIKGLENAGETPANDANNFQPRVGLAWDLKGDGRRVFRAGYGIYMDMAYTNSNALFAASDATGKGFGAVLAVDNQSGIRNADGTFYQVGQPASNIASQNTANPNVKPLFGQWTDPGLQMPYTKQTAIGYSHELMPSTIVTADFVFAQGRDLNTRPRLNTLNASGVRRFPAAGLVVSPAAVTTRPAISAGKSEYKAVMFGLKRRMTKGLDFTATYTLADAKSTIGASVDALNANNLQDSTLLYDDPKVLGPTGLTDARHAGTITAVYLIKGFSIAPFFIFKSPLPVSIIEGLDTNANGERNDIPVKAYQYAGIGVAPKEIGNCETYNCGRGAWRTQLNLKVSKSFNLMGRSRIEAIGEIFNLMNAMNPSGFTTGRLLGTGAPNPTFMQPTSYSGDFQQPEQRVGQIGFRFSF